MKMQKVIWLVFSVISFSSFAQIPNSDFEVWENYIDNLDGCAYVSNTYQKPDFWVGSLPKRCETYSFSIAKVNESYPAGTGQYCMKVQPDVANGVRGIATSSDVADPMINQIPQPTFALNSRPEKLKFYYKYLPNSGDTLLVRIYFYKNGDVINEAYIGTNETVSAWTEAEVPISYSTPETPDSATIYFLVGIYSQHSESVLYVDNLSFEGNVNSVAKNNLLNDELKIFTNPANDQFTIRLNNMNSEKKTICIYNLTGNLVQRIQMNNIDQSIDTRLLSSGIYLLEFQCNDQKIVKRLIIRK